MGADQGPCRSVIGDQAFAAAARKLGAKIHRHTPVTATTPRADGGWDVETPAGTIHADFVVNAAGLWAREVARAGRDQACRCCRSNIITW